MLRRSWYLSVSHLWPAFWINSMPGRLNLSDSRLSAAFSTSVANWKRRKRSQSNLKVCARVLFPSLGMGISLLTLERQVERFFQEQGSGRERAHSGGRGDERPTQV